MDGTVTPLAHHALTPPSGSVRRALEEDGSLSPGFDPRLSDEDVSTIYRYMVETRYLDERLTALQRQGRIGFHIGSLGEEATIIGAAFAMRKQDWLFPCYREFGAALLRGLNFQRFMDNMFGNENDPVKGRQMPDHYTCRESHWLSISSPVGTQITQAVGFAWAGKLKKEDLATLVYFGDGATSSSDSPFGNEFRRGLQDPGGLLLPEQRLGDQRSRGASNGVGDVCGQGCRLRRARCSRRRQRRLRGGSRRQGSRRAWRYARGEGPTLIEALTYRMGGHSTSDDPNAYRASDDLKEWGKSGIRSTACGTTSPRAGFGTKSGSGRSSGTWTQSSKPPWRSPRRRRSPRSKRCSKTCTRSRPGTSLKSAPRSSPDPGPPITAEKKRATSTCRR